MAQAHTAKPVLQQRPPPRKVNNSGVVKKAIVTEKSASKKPGKRFSSVPDSELDIWSTEDMTVPRSSEPVIGPEVGPPRHLQPKALRMAPPLPTKVKAVEVDMSGCSYNPEPEAHQVCGRTSCCRDLSCVSLLSSLFSQMSFKDALAALVAAEMKRQLRQELAPKAPPKLVDILEAAGGEAGMDEIEKLQVRELESLILRCTRFEGEWTRSGPCPRSLVSAGGGGT